MPNETLKIEVGINLNEIIMRKLKLIGFALMAVMFLASCGGNNNDKNTSTENNAQTNIKVEFVGSYDNGGDFPSYSLDIVINNVKDNIIDAEIGAEGTPINKNEYAKYKIPNNALAVFSKTGGGADTRVFYAQQKENVILVYSATENGYESWDYQYDVIKKISI